MSAKSGVLSLPSALSSSSSVESPHSHESFLAQQRPQVQKHIVRDTMTAMIMTIAAAPEVLLNSFFMPMRQPCLGGPSLMDLKNQKLDG